MSETGRQYSYDAESKLIQVSGDLGVATYTYDGDGKRVMRVYNGAITRYWTGTGSDALSESTQGGTTAAEYIFFNGKRIARLDKPYVPIERTLHYYLSNHLGSTSMVVDGMGQREDESDTFPFGGEYKVVDSDPNRYLFTGKERDSETGLDYFGARYMSSAQGRFTSTDPLIHPSSSPKGMVGFLSNPQNWNKYAYVLNNPLIRVDPDGMADYLYIQSNVAKSTGASLTAGHANLVRYNTDTRTTTTYGLWPDGHPDIVGAGLANGAGSDVRTNFADDAPENYALKYGVELTSEQSSKLDATVATTSEWGYTNTCATWASSTFTTVTGVKIDSSELAGVTDTPRAIGDAINAKVVSDPSSGAFPPGPAGAPAPAPQPTPPSSRPITPTQPKRPLDDK